LRVSRRSPPMDRTTRPMPRFDRSASMASKLGRAARQPVRLGDGQHVALAHEGETFGELHALGGAGNLFAENAVGAGRRQVTLLRRQPCGLVRGGLSARIRRSCPCAAFGVRFAFACCRTVRPIRQYLFYSDAISRDLLPCGNVLCGLALFGQVGTAPGIRRPRPPA
jgi:hypothetical protein